ncbi:hypothetical protein LR48_Vigan08g172400 [Vigna angularis]|uniref:Uncharacterized protein n=1 Tax=Phaseolus angularis TaxID=3914 RepID=A0A0L9V7I4_PHAAN|nr:hypothetical protein LR48_Vigan08g172400 [Vigna angularis]
MVERSNSERLMTERLKMRTNVLKEPKCRTVKQCKGRTVTVWTSGHHNKGKDERSQQQREGRTLSETVKKDERLNSLDERFEQFGRTASATVEKDERSLSTLCVLVLAGNRTDHGRRPQDAPAGGRNRGGGGDTGGGHSPHERAGEACADEGLRGGDPPLPAGRGSHRGVQVVTGRDVPVRLHPGDGRSMLTDDATFWSGSPQDFNLPI